MVGKRTLNIYGAISAANYVLLPKLKSQMLGMTGQFLYIQVRARLSTMLNGCTGHAGRQVCQAVVACSTSSASHILRSCESKLCLTRHNAQVQIKPSKDWAIHIEVLDVSDKVYRVSLSNIYKAGKVRY